MSFLLDALRKSELERSIGEIPKLLPDTPVKVHRKSRVPWLLLVILLVLINLGALVYIIRIDRADEKVSVDLTKSQAMETNAAKFEELQPVQQTQAPKKPDAPLQAQTAPASTLALPETTPRTLAQLSSGKRNYPVSQMADLLPKPNTLAQLRQSGSIDKAIKKETTKRSAREKTPDKVVQDRAPAKDRSAKPEPNPEFTTLHRDFEKTGNSSDKAPTISARDIPEFALLPRPDSPKAETESIPLLTQMPRDFQREVPTLNINVFVYSGNPSERFVVINMTKYQSGDTIESGPKIIEIRPDSLVLDYFGKTFRIKRP